MLQRAARGERAGKKQYSLTFPLNYLGSLELLSPINCRHAAIDRTWATDISTLWSSVTTVCTPLYSVLIGFLVRGCVSSLTVFLHISQMDIMDKVKVTYTSSKPFYHTLMYILISILMAWCWGDRKIVLLPVWLFIFRCKCEESAVWD